MSLHEPFSQLTTHLFWSLLCVSGRESLLTGEEEEEADYKLLRQKNPQPIKCGIPVTTGAICQELEHTQ